MWNKFAHTILFIGCFSITWSQSKSEIVQQRIEFISEQLESEEVDLTDVVQILNYHLHFF
jgi:hypothetical protein